MTYAPKNIVVAFAAAGGCERVGERGERVAVRGRG